ncbi:SRPBCC domain-containing protein [Panacibacter ginsenosidivorans]|uniref:SRPBCC domain-containing protein n=1 Tax=Panacibacter ginsenosidivorans TaxID=1813871 RepID=A0A5B8V6L4_9BACT|nr:SRPBCC domain-containing protein [Panacibacter ginsenosidivorans]QEC66286.1 SRPBCC domain-containing protein [Panacibacter ginsenosidivorans]
MKKVTASIAINSSSSKIIDAFLQPHMLKEWWNVERCLIQPQSGGLYTLAWNINSNGFGYISSGIITVYQPGHMLVIEKLVYLNPELPILGPMALSIHTEQLENAVSLYLTQDGYKEGPAWDWYYNAVKDTWPQVLQTLKIYLEKE